MASESPFYSFTANTIKHQPYDLKQLKGKVVLVVNTASKCGFTPQLKNLETLYQELNAKGLVILGFPCNQFGQQDPEKEEVIEESCQRNYGVTFQMMEKVDVNGEKAHPLFQWLKEQKKQLFMSRIKWNFEKFLIDKNGKVVDRYISTTDPIKIKPVIQKLLEVEFACTSPPEPSKPVVEESTKTPTVVEVNEIKKEAEEGQTNGIKP